MWNNHQSAEGFAKLRAETDFVENIEVNFVMFGLHDRQLKVLGLQCPRTGSSVLPGGHLHSATSIADSAQRHLRDIVDSEQVYHEQLQVFDDRKFESGLGVLRIVHYALLTPEQCDGAKGQLRPELQWHSIESALSAMADQEEILRSSLACLRTKARREPVVFHLLPSKFTLLNLQEAYEAIFEVRFRKSNFRRKIAKMNFIVPCQEKQSDVAHRAAVLFRFDRTLYQEAYNSGFDFSI